MIRIYSDLKEPNVAAAWVTEVYLCKQDMYWVTLTASIISQAKEIFVLFVALYTVLHTLRLFKKSYE